MCKLTEPAHPHQLGGVSALPLHAHQSRLQKDLAIALGRTAPRLALNRMTGRPSLVHCCRR